MRDESEIGEIDGPTLRARLDSGEPIALLDVREPWERSLARIAVLPGVTDLAIPLGDLPGRMAEVVKAVGGDPAGRPIVVYCHHGVRSLHAAHWLARGGFAGTINLDGGIDAWSLRVDPTVPRY